MSIILKLFGFTGLPQWALELIVLGLLAGGVSLWWHSHNVAEVKKGIQEQQQADNAASAKLLADTARLTKAEHDRADKAEANYHDADQALKDYLAAHPVLDVSLLCRKPAPHGRGQVVSSAGTAHSGDAATDVATGMVQSVPNTDHGIDYDRPSLLRALAGLADEKSNALREFQQRQ